MLTFGFISNGPAGATPCPLSKALYMNGIKGRFDDGDVDIEIGRAERLVETKIKNARSIQKAVLNDLEKKNATI